MWSLLWRGALWQARSRRMPAISSLMKGSYTTAKAGLLLYQMILYYNIVSRFWRFIEVRNLLSKYNSSLTHKHIHSNMIRGLIYKLWEVVKLIEEIPGLVGATERMTVLDSDEIVYRTILGLTLFLMFFIIKVAFIRPHRGKHTPKQEYLNVFEVLFEVHVRSRFPRQSAECLSCLKNGVRTALRHKSSRRPAVLLLLHTSRTKSTAESLATRLVRVCLASIGQHKPPGYVEKILTVDGSNFSQFTDFWNFYGILKEDIIDSKMVIVRNFHSVHPHAATLVCSLTHEMLSLDSQAIVVLLLEMAWHNDEGTECANKLAETWIDHWFGHGLDEGSRQDLFTTLTARAVVVKNEPVLPKEN